MGSLLFSILCALLILLVECKVEILVRGNVKVILESFQTNCDHNFVEYFHKVPNNEMLYTFRVVKPAPSFFLNFTMRTFSSQRVMYRLQNVDGCQFISNPIMNRVFAHTYNAIVINKSFTGCPIPPKVYYLKNINKAHIVPTFHPIGRYQVNTRVRMSESKGPCVMEIIWKYNVIRLK